MFVEDLIGALTFVLFPITLFTIFLFAMFLLSRFKLTFNYKEMKFIKKKVIFDNEKQNNFIGSNNKSSKSSELFFLSLFSYFSKYKDNNSTHLPVIYHQNFECFISPIKESQESVSQ